MKVLTSIVSFALFAMSVVAQQNGITINSLTDVTECRPSLITWTGGTPPYYLSILPAGQPNGPAFVSFNATSATSLTWNVNLGAGTSAFLNLRDSTGALGQSATFTVIAGSDISCVTQSLSVSTGPTATGSPTTATSAASGGSGSVTITSSTKRPSSTTTSTSTSDAVILSKFNLGAAAVAGVVALVLTA